MRQEQAEIRPSSTVVRTTVAGRPAYVKQYRGGQWGRPQDVVRAQAAAEVQIVSRLAAQSGVGPRFGRLTILEADADGLSLTTAEVTGKPLESFLLGTDHVAHRGGCVRALVIAGRWQRVLQEIPTDGFQPVVAETEPFELVEYCDIRLRALRSQGVRWPGESDRTRILDWLRGQLAATPADELRQVFCHGDFGPTNLLWDGRTLTPIDFATCCLNYPLVDLTYLIHRLEVLHWQFPWRRWPIDLWRRACLRGYGSPDAAKQPIYRAQMVRHNLCRLLTLVHDQGRQWRRRCHNAWVYQCASRRIRGLLAES